MGTIELNGKVKELKELQRMAEEITAEIESIKDELKNEMAARGADELTTTEYKLRYSTVTSNRFDTTAFKKEYATLYSQFTKQSVSKRFSVA